MVLRMKKKNPGNTGQRHSEETKKRIGDAQRGEKGHWYGKRLCEATRRKISESNKGRISFWRGKKLSEETKRKMSESRKGRVVSEETRRKIGLANSGKTGKKHSEEHKRKISESIRGEKNPLYGKRLSEDHKRKLSLANSGDKSALWKGGISKLPYGDEWTLTLKKAIRQRDNNKCQLCGRRKYKRDHHVHHIDYDKMNNNPYNLVTLCASCHIKTNKGRNRWANLFSKMVFTKIRRVK